MTSFYRMYSLPIDTSVLLSELPLLFDLKQDELED